MLARLLPRPDRASRAVQVKPWGDWSEGSQTYAGVDVSPDGSLNLLTVYGCVALIADTIATLPVDVFRREDGVQVEVPKPRWMGQPNVEIDWVDLVTQLLSSLLLDGNAYVLRTLDGAGGTTEVGVLHPDRVRVDRRAVGGAATYWVDGREYRAPLLHLRGVMRPGALKGLSPVEAARQAIGLGLAAQEYGARFFGQGANPSGVIQWPGDITLEQARMLKSNWVRDHGGTANAHLPGVLHGGATWQQVSITPEQAQFLDTRRFTAAEIAAQMFRVDPTMLGIAVEGTSLTYANLEQRGIHLVQFTLGPWIVRLERLLATLLPKPQFAKFNVDGLLRADLKTRYEAAQIAIQSGWLSANDVRALEDRPAIEGGDRYLWPPGLARYMVEIMPEPAPMPMPEDDPPPLMPSMAEAARSVGLRVVRDEHGLITRVEEVEADDVG